MIVEDGFIEAEVIDRKEMIDQHYYAVASEATVPKPAGLDVPEDRFRGHRFRPTLQGRRMKACARGRRNL